MTRTPGSVRGAAGNGGPYRHRWSPQEIGADAQGRLPGSDADVVVRRFDAPEALDTRFYEVRAKSALNRVPERSRVPFEWTINPYRGCTHACVYCLAGDTPVLLADGRTRRLASLAVGDSIVGTKRRGRSRRFVETQVLAHWSTVKPAFSVTLEDRRVLVASGDHRFLTRRGWEHVTGAGRGGERRPHLTVGSELLGTSPARTRVVSIEPLPDVRPLYDITTGTGDFIADGTVSHNCFARPTHEFLDMNAGRDFDREIVVKVNVPEVLRAELARPSWARGHVALGTNTDPYQWVEGRYKLMRGIWEALRDAANPASVLTKSPLVLRDVDLLLELAERASVSACLSVPTLDEKAWRATEPHTPNPRARLEAVAELNRRGIPTGILIAPLMPGINDDPAQVERILAFAGEAGATSVGGQTLFLRGATRDVFMDWLRASRPDLVGRYEELYAHGAYAPRAERRRIEATLRGAPRLSSMTEERFLRRRAGPRRIARAPEEPGPPPQEALF